MREGQAIFASSYCRYEGTYRANKRHGKGKETDGMGNVFVGEYEEGKVVKGKMNYANGDLYVGEMNDEGDRHGKGKFISCDDGFEIEGMWENDECKG
jgi:hypothetical protein